MFKTVQLTKSFLRLSEKVISNYKIYENETVRASYTYICKRFTSNIKRDVSEKPVKIEGLNENINVSSLTQDDPELEKKLRVIILEADIMRQEHGRVPDLSSLKHEHWKELLSKTTRSQRNKYFDFLFKIEKKKENRKVKQEQAKLERENRPPYQDDGHIRYGLNHNTFFLRIYETTINHLYNSKLITAIQFGQKLVVDCGYDKNMTSRECINCAKQLMLLFSENRMHDEPFDLHLCNAEKNSKTIQALHKNIPVMYEPWFPLHIHEQSYLDVFPKEKLVYLTPHCREELTHYDHDAVYIIGAIVDKMHNEPLSLARAKKEGIRTAKLPLDKYLQWGSGSGKSLTLNHCTSILLDVKKDGDWMNALRHVPKRKIIDEPIKFGDGRRMNQWRMKSENRSTNERINRIRDKGFVKKLLQN